MKINMLIESLEVLKREKQLIQILEFLEFQDERLEKGKQADCDNYDAIASHQDHKIPNILDDFLGEGGNIECCEPSIKPHVSVPLQRLEDMRVEDWVDAFECFLKNMQ
jgi:hypothetical protein